VAAQGSSGVVDSVAATQGAIGYAEVAQVAQAGSLGMAALRVGGDPVDPAPEAASAMLEASDPLADRGTPDFAWDLDWDTTESGAYPLVAVSYVVACASPATDRSEAESESELLRAYLSYVISQEGQEWAADSTGSAPIPAHLRTAFQSAVDAIG
jgi:phosphate transport system substrate-binding protein